MSYFPIRKMGSMLLLVLLVGLTGCSAGSAAADVDVAVDEVLRLWQDGAAIIIDVRTPGEYGEGHIPGVMNIPLNELEQRMGEVPGDKKVILICRTGNRSAQGAKLLRDKGMDNVFNSAGGMTTWRGPVEK